MSHTNDRLCFAMFVFSIFIMIPLMIFGGWMWTKHTETLLIEQCLKQQKIYVNQMCIQLPK